MPKSELLNILHEHLDLMRQKREVDASLRHHDHKSKDIIIKSGYHEALKIDWSILNRMTGNQ